MSKASQEVLNFIESSGPTYATSTTFEESLLAAGAGISLVDSVVAASKFKKNPPVGFALISPPGHHAISQGPKVFCVFGNAAVAACYAQCEHGLKRVFIVDFDVHHGNRTNDDFYDDPDIFFLSTYQDGSYPGSGKIYDLGHGSGEGATLNLPLPVKLYIHGGTLRTVASIPLMGLLAPRPQHCERPVSSSFLAAQLLWIH